MTTNAEERNKLAWTVPAGCWGGGCWVFLLASENHPATLLHLGGRTAFHYEQLGSSLNFFPTFVEPAIGKDLLSSFRNIGIRGRDPLLKGLDPAQSIFKFQ